MRRSAYAWQWLKLAITHAWGPTETVATIAGITVPSIGLATADMSSEHLVWLIPLVLFIFLLLVRFFQAPWWIHQEQEQVAAGREANLQRQLDAVTAERDAMRAEADTELTPAAEVADAFRQLARSGGKLLGENRSEAERRRWVEHVRRVVHSALRKTHADDFDTETRKIRNNDPLIRSKQSVGDCVQWLNGWAQVVKEEHIKRDCKLREFLAIVAEEPPRQSA